MLKTLYRVKSVKLSIILEGERVVLKRGQEFEAFPYEIPAGFLDLVESLGPADFVEPGEVVEQQQNEPEVVPEELPASPETPEPVPVKRKKEVAKKSVDPPVVRRSVKKA